MKMSALEYILYALFPRRCALCGKVVPPDMPVCEKCEADLEYVKGELCPRCGRLRQGEKVLLMLVSPTLFRIADRAVLLFWCREAFGSCPEI